MSVLRIARTALDDAGRFFEQQGLRGLEGTGMLAGTTGHGITRCVIPDQIGRRSRLGVSVEVTMTGKLQLATALGPHERYLARIHSHPGAAFHSATDDENPGLTAQGALSIVVPDFGRGLRDGLAACAIFRRAGARWVELSPAEVREQLLVVG
jgi:hypothetical protein